MLKYMQAPGADKCQRLPAGPCTRTTSQFSPHALSKCWFGIGHLSHITVAVMLPRQHASLFRQACKLALACCELSLSQQKVPLGSWTNIALTLLLHSRKAKAASANHTYIRRARHLCAGSITLRRRYTAPSKAHVHLGRLLACCYVQTARPQGMT